MGTKCLLLMFLICALQCEGKHLEDAIASIRLAAKEAAESILGGISHTFNIGWPFGLDSFTPPLKKPATDVVLLEEDHDRKMEDGRHHHGKHQYDGPSHGGTYEGTPHGGPYGSHNGPSLPPQPPPPHHHHDHGPGPHGQPPPPIYGGVNNNNENYNDGQNSQYYNRPNQGNGPFNPNNGYNPNPNQNYNNNGRPNQNSRPQHYDNNYNNNQNNGWNQGNRPYDGNNGYDQNSNQNYNNNGRLNQNNYNGKNQGGFDQNNGYNQRPDQNNRPYDNNGQNNQGIRGNDGNYQTSFKPFTPEVTQTPTTYTTKEPAFTPKPIENTITTNRSTAKPDEDLQLLVPLNPNEFGSDKNEAPKREAETAKPKPAEEEVFHKDIRMKK